MRWRLEVVLYALEMLEVLEGVRRVLLCILEAVEGGFCLPIVLEVPEVMCCVLLYGGFGGRAQFRDFEICIVAVFSLQSATKCQMNVVGDTCIGSA